MTEISPATLLTNQRYTNWRARQHFPALGLDMLQVLAMKLAMNQLNCLSSVIGQCNFDVSLIEKISLQYSNKLKPSTEYFKTPLN